MAFIRSYAIPVLLGAVLGLAPQVAAALIPAPYFWSVATAVFGSLSALWIRRTRSSGSLTLRSEDMGPFEPGMLVEVSSHCGDERGA